MLKMRNRDGAEQAIRSLDDHVVSVDHVSLEVLLPGGLVRTEGAHEGLLAGVGPKVPLQVTDLLERVAAEHADSGTISRTGRGSGVLRSVRMVIK